MHLSPEFGLTYKEIEDDGFHINKKVEMLLSSNTANGIVKSMGLADIGFADALEELKPDLAVILGDRYEMLCAAQSCLIYKVPVAHLYGGEISEGAYDDAIRHAITKLSHLHFTSTEEYRQHVIQMGEAPEHVFYVGGLGIDNIRNEAIMRIEELEESIKFKLGDKYLVVTYHPVTLGNSSAAEQSNALLTALDNVNGEYNLLFTLPNSDTDGRVIISKIKQYVATHPNNSIAVTSLGKKRYYSALKYASAVIGNSSSGLGEAPSFHIPTLNIGERQKGRTRGQSVYDVSANTNDIIEGLRTVLSDDFKKIAQTAPNPYEKEGTLEAIFNVICNYPLEGIISKQFYTLLR